MHNFVKTLFSVLLLLFCSVLTAQNRTNETRDPNRIWLDSEVTHRGDYQWKMIKAGDTTDPGEKISSSDYPTEKWLPAIVPGTVLNSLVYNQNTLNLIMELIIRLNRSWFLIFLRSDEIFILIGSVPSLQFLNLLRGRMFGYSWMESIIGQKYGWMGICLVPSMVCLYRTILMWPIL